MDRNEPARGLVAQALVLDQSGHRLLDDVSLSVAPGSMLGVTGPSGSGKTTLLGVLAGLVPPPMALAGFARITPSETPDVLPVVATTRPEAAALPAPVTALGTEYPDAVVEGHGLSGESVPVRVVARAEALPGLGGGGTLGDLESSLAEFTPPNARSHRRRSAPRDRSGGGARVAPGGASWHPGEPTRDGPGLTGPPGRVE